MTPPILRDLAALADDEELSHRVRVRLQLVGFHCSTARGPLPVQALEELLAAAVTCRHAPDDREVTRLVLHVLRRLARGSVALVTKA